jgi:rhomboid family GlyGly-CTERM serine protease
MNKTLEKTSFSILRYLGRLLQPAQAFSSLPLFSLSFGLAALIVSVVPKAEGMLQYDREAIAGGEIWRIFTGHWTHWNAEHLIWDVIVFVALGVACERIGRRGYIFCVFAGAPIISLAVWSVLPQMQYYRGLSGLDAALYMLAGVTLLREWQFGSPLRKSALFILLLAALGAKVGYETLYGRTIFVQNMGGFVPVPIAHLAGALVGTTVALMPRNSLKSREEIALPRVC